MNLKNPFAIISALVGAKVLIYNGLAGDRANGRVSGLRDLWFVITLGFLL